MTRVFGVVGHPISHSLSPVMHHAAFRALGLDAIYAPFDVPPRDLKAVLGGLHVCGIDGLNVTVPHKERIVRALDSRVAVDPVAAALGAVNTLVRTERGFAAHNTDVAGFRRALVEELRTDGRNRRVLLLGAGGAAKAVAWALASAHPQHIVLSNRTRAKAEAMRRWLARAVRGLKIDVVRFDRRSLAAAMMDSDLLVNATSLGLKTRDPLPVDPAAIHRRLAVFDLVYRSPTSPLVQAARRRGALAVDGVPMLVYQGAESFRLWWRRRAPVEVMRRAVERAVRVRSDQWPSDE